MNANVHRLPQPGGEPSVEAVDPFLATLDQSPEHAAYHASVERLNAASEALNSGAALSHEHVRLQEIRDAEARAKEAQEAADRAEIAAGVSSEAAGIRDNVYRDAYTRHARERARQAHENGEDMPESAIHFGAEHAAREAVRGHDRAVSREMAFSRAHSLAELDPDEIFRVMDEAHEEAKLSGDMHEFNTYADRLSPKMRAKYLERLDAKEAAAAKPPEPEPEPDDPTPNTPPRPNIPPAVAEARRRRLGRHETTPPDDVDRQEQLHPARGRARVVHQPKATDPGEQGGPSPSRKSSPEPAAQPTPAEGPQHSDGQDYDPKKTWRRHFPRLIDFANRDISYQRPDGAGRFSPKAIMHWLGTRNLQRSQLKWQRRGFGWIPGGDSLTDPRVANFYRLKRYGIAVTPEGGYDGSGAPSQERQIRIPEIKITEGDKKALDRVRALHIPFPNESEADHNARLQRIYNQDRRYWRERSEKPLSRNFDLPRFVAKLAQDFQERAANYLQPEQTLEWKRDDLYQGISSQLNVTLEEAAAIARTLNEQDILEYWKNEAGKAVVDREGHFAGFTYNPARFAPSQQRIPSAA